MVLYCDVIKQTESELPKLLTLRYSKLKGKIFFVLSCFAKPSTARISGTDQPIFMGFSVECSNKNAYIQFV